jgi:hypothetical protein
LTPTTRTQLGHFIGSSDFSKVTSLKAAASSALRFARVSAGRESILNPCKLLCRILRLRHNGCVIRLVATDLDGTFRDASFVPPSSHVTAVGDLMKRDVTVLAATSRRTIFKGVRHAVIPSKHAPCCSLFMCTRAENGYTGRMRRMGSQVAEDLISALESALLGLGLVVERIRETHEPNTPGLRPRLDAFLRVNGHVVAVEAKSVVTGASAPQLLFLAETLANPLLVVADRIAEDAKARFQEGGVNYYDARGHVRLVLPGVFVDTELNSTLDSRYIKASSPLDGEVAKEVALILLDKPDVVSGVRSIARTIQRAPSAVANALKRLRGAGLVTSANEPVTPELFWELAAVWRRAPIALASAPRPVEARTTDPLNLGLKPDVELGWALTDSSAARAWGMPLVLSSDYPPDFYVPSVTSMQRAIATLGGIVRSDERGCTVSLAPTPLVCHRRVTLPNEAWKVAEHVVVALDLARDESRGREVLERWIPPEGIVRVW